MKVFRAFIAVGVVLALAGAAQADDAGGVTGSGFVREGKGRDALKKSLNILATDATVDSGTARYSEHATASGKPITVHVQLDCMVIDANHAFASGEASSANDDFDGQQVAIHIIDNGGSRDAYGIEVQSLPAFLAGLILGDCGAGSVDTQSIGGGNFRVQPSG